MVSSTQPRFASATTSTRSCIRAGLPRRVVAPVNARSRAASPITSARVNVVGVDAGFGSRFDAHASYEDRAVNPDRLAAIRRHAGRRILDVGCGSGAYVRFLEAEHELVGV